MYLEIRCIYSFWSRNIERVFTDKIYIIEICVYIFWNIPIFLRENISFVSSSKIYIDCYPCERFYLTILIKSFQYNKNDLFYWINFMYSIAKNSFILKVLNKFVIKNFKAINVRCVFLLLKGFRTVNNNKKTIFNHENINIIIDVSTNFINIKKYGIS